MHVHVIYINGSLQRLKWLFAYVLPRRPRFDPEQVLVRFGVEKVAREHVCVRPLRFSCASVIPQPLRTRRVDAALTEG